MSAMNSPIEFFYIYKVVTSYVYKIAFQLSPFPLLITHFDNVIKMWNDIKNHALHLILYSINISLVI